VEGTPLSMLQREEKLSDTTPGIVHTRGVPMAMEDPLCNPSRSSAGMQRIKLRNWSTPTHSKKKGRNFQQNKYQKGKGGEKRPFVKKTCVRGKGDRSGSDGAAQEIVNECSIPGDQKRDVGLHKNKKKKSHVLKGRERK